MSVRRIRRTLLLSLVSAAGIGAVAGSAAGAAAPPAPAAPPPRAAAPAPVTTPPAEATPARAGRTTATPRGRDRFAWARPSAAALADAWPGLRADDLARDATRGDLDIALRILDGVPHPAAKNPAAPATIWVAHNLFARALGLAPEMRGLSRLSTADGRRFRLPRNFAGEILVRELGLVYNYPAEDEALERARSQPIRLAELVYMLDRARRLDDWQLERLRAYRTLTLQTMEPARRALVQAALVQVGQPYIWGGDWIGPKSPWGAQPRGGFDCSGLVWWTYKAATVARSMSVGATLRGRTADDMAWEKPKDRIDAYSARPADLIFFGPDGRRSKRGTISHMAIALGDGWIIHSSGSRGGVSISHLDQYWPSGTAFGRAMSPPG